MNLLNISRPRDSLLSQSPSAILALLRPSAKSHSVKTDGLSSTRNDPKEDNIFSKLFQFAEKDANETNRKVTKESEAPPSFIVRTPKKSILVRKNTKATSMLLNEDKTPRTPVNANGGGSSCPSFKALAENETLGENMTKSNLIVSTEVPQAVQHKRVSFAADVKSREGGQRPRKICKKIRKQSDEEIEDIALCEQKRCEEYIGENLKFRMALNGVVSPSLRQNGSPQAENFSQSLFKQEPARDYGFEIKEHETNSTSSTERRSTRKLSDLEITNMKLPSINPHRQRNSILCESNLLGSHRSAKSLKEFISPRSVEPSLERHNAKDNRFNAGLFWKKDDDLSSVMKARLQMVHHFDTPMSSTMDLLFPMEERARPKRTIFRAHHDSEGMLIAL